ncbi:MAG: LacI family DNA-binding transcriptional regulator [Planctomycetes bacterium]|nr:LacI family DNA-binding transcriptional regulator [Planctomycetota bacterium]
MAAKTPVSLKQLAKMAQLSTATISRVINNTGRFSEKTRDRVKALIQETGYVPNVTAFVTTF